MIPDKSRYSFVHTVLLSTAYGNPGVLLLALELLDVSL
jgi:hypothetical protein